MFSKQLALLALFSAVLAAPVPSPTSTPSDNEGGIPGWNPKWGVGPVIFHTKTSSSAPAEETGAGIPGWQDWWGIGPVVTGKPTPRSTDDDDHIISSGKWPNNKYEKGHGPVIDKTSGATVATENIVPAQLNNKYEHGHGLPVHQDEVPSRTSFNAKYEHGHGLKLPVEPTAALIARDFNNKFEHGHGLPVHVDEPVDSNDEAGIPGWNPEWGIGPVVTPTAA